MDFGNIIAITSGVGGILSSIAAIVAVVMAQRSFASERHRWHSDHSWENALRLEERFHSSKMREARAQVARVLINGEKLDTVHNAANNLFNFFELLGRLVKEKVIDRELAYFVFSQWFLPYWNTAQDQINEHRYGNLTRWQDAEALYDTFTKIQNHTPLTKTPDVDKETENQKQFLEAEAHFGVSYEYHIEIVQNTLGRSIFTLYSNPRVDPPQIDLIGINVLINRVMEPVFTPSSRPVSNPNIPDLFDIISRSSDAISLQQGKVNQLGQEGWELVAVLPNKVNDLWLFKRLGS